MLFAQLNSAISTSSHWRIQLYRNGINCRWYNLWKEPLFVVRVSETTFNGLTIGVSAGKELPNRFYGLRFQGILQKMKMLFINDAPVPVNLKL